VPDDLNFLQYVPEYVEAEQDCNEVAFEESYTLMPAHAAAETHAGQYKMTTDMHTCIWCCSFKFTSSHLKIAACGAQHLSWSHDDAHSHAQS